MIFYTLINPLIANDAYSSNNCIHVSANDTYVSRTKARTFTAFSAAMKGQQL